MCFDGYRPSITNIALLMLIAVVVLALIPVYRRLLPQLYSPWSGQGLAVKPAQPRYSVEDKAIPLLMMHALGSTEMAVAPMKAIHVDNYDGLD